MEPEFLKGWLVMPPVIAAVVTAAVAIGHAALAGTPPQVLDVEDTPEFPTFGTLEVCGQLFRFGEVSTHLNMREGDRVRNVGSISFRHNEEFVRQCAGIPIFAPDFKTEIGTITCAWIDGDGQKVRFTGYIRDSQRARACLSRPGFGVCISVDFGGPTKIKTGEYACRPASVQVCVPGQSAFRSSWIRLVDASITPEPEPVSDRPRAADLFQHVGW